MVGGKLMKRASTTLTLVLAALCVTILAGCVHVQRSVPTEEAWARLVGTWVNTDYSGAQPYVQQLVIRPDFVGEDWDTPTDTAPDGVWAVTPKNAWTDWRGDTYCQFSFRYTEQYPGHGVGLIRVDRAGKLLELNSRAGSENQPCPEEIDPEIVSTLAWYFIYHRK
jgi:hypothetical protein